MPLDSAIKWGYAVFGNVVKGRLLWIRSHIKTDVKMVTFGDRQVPFRDVPNKDVIIRSIRRI